MSEQPIDFYAEEKPVENDGIMPPIAQDGRFITPFSVVVIITAILMISVVGWGIYQNTLSQPEEGSAPGFSLPIIGTGDEIFTLSDYRGSVVVINFWGSWCGPCRAEAPMLQRTFAEYQDQGVTFVGMAVKDIESDSLEYIDEFSITYPNVMDIGGYMEDEYRTQGVPETFVVDTEGNISKFFFAQPNEAQLRQSIEDAMGL